MLCPRFYFFVEALPVDQAQGGGGGGGGGALTPEQIAATIEYEGDLAPGERFILPQDIQTELDIEVFNTRRPR